MADSIELRPVAEQTIDELMKSLDTHVPAIMEELAGLLGKRAPRVPSAERRRFMSLLRRKLKRLWPAFQELDTLQTAPESSQKTETIKAALRDILVEMFAPPKIRKSPDAGRLGWLIQAAAKATDPPRAAWARQVQYIEARTHLWNVLMSVYSRVPFPRVHAVLDSWVADGEHKRYAHSLRLLVVAAARFRSVPTRLASDRAAIELQNEYLRSANLFEQQLRLLTCLVRDAAGVIKPWTYWQQQNFKNLLEMASLDPALATLVPFIDRNVRNALTHGPPIVERRSQRCEFRDRQVSLTWTWQEYFTNTRALTLAVLACSHFDSFRQLIEIQIFVRTLTSNMEK